jgi:lysyl-tRNA synthetase, class II
MAKVKRLAIIGEPRAETRELWTHAPIVILTTIYAALVGVLDVIRAIGLATSGLAFNIERRVNIPTSGLANVALLFLGCLMVFLSYQLWMKKRAAIYFLAGLLLFQCTSLIVWQRSFLAGATAFVLSLLLVHFRRDFTAKPDPASLRKLKVVAPILAVTFYGYGLLGLWLLHGRLGLEVGLRGLLGRPFLIVAADSYGIEFESWEVLFHFSLAVLFFIGIVWMTAMLFRPHRSVSSHSEEEHHKARELMRRYGSDTIAYFNLRHDKSLFFLDDRIFLAYRCLGGTVLMSGDPVGPAELVPEITARFHNYCVERGWRMTGMGESGEYLDDYERAGLKSLCYGEEAVVHLDDFTLEGRKNKTLRHAVTKWEKTGTRMEFMYNAGIPSHLRHELGQISADWRGDNPETGFSMGLGRLMSSEDPDCLLAIAYNAADEPIGFAYLVPVYPKAGYSLDITRTSCDTSNGINEYIFTRTALFLKEQGYRFLSLHFAAFSQHYRKDRKEDGSQVVRVICRVVDRFLPVMSLYDFDRKFQPSWKSRYLVFESYADIPRLGITAVTIESFYKLLRRVKRNG